MFTPGIFAIFIVDNLIVHEKWEAYKYALYAFILGLLTYITLQIFYFCGDLLRAWFCHLPNTWTSLKIWDVLLNGNKDLKLSPKELIWAVFLSVGVALVISKLIKENKFFTFAQKYNISNKASNQTVFVDFMSQQSWLSVQDLTNNLEYIGWPSNYEEKNGIQEILLRDVQIFCTKENRKIIGERESCYICKPIGVLLLSKYPPEPAHQSSAQ
jgi:hypothetical protein